ncbi:hypothetical protein DFJ74DRAFT_702477 [Hyaloraphidium curvatum]|nr:hypothetical protein DFJ74DRAFT_702477 [Hyaloraphidium curvatum]
MSVFRDPARLAAALSLASIPCAFYVALLPHFSRLAVLRRLPGGYKNADPRRQVADIVGGRAEGVSEADAGLVSRATGAHANNLEMFPLFAAGVLAALHAGADVFRVRDAAGVYIAARIAYNRAYVGTSGEAASWWRDVPFNTAGLACGYLFYKAIAAVLADK